MAVRTQTRTIQPGAYLDPTPRFVQVVEMREDKVSPRTVRVRLRRTDPSLDEYAQVYRAAGFAAGIWWPNPGGETWQDQNGYGGALRLRFGSGQGIMREVIADLRDGEFNIPPCDVVTASVAWWRPNSSAPSDPSDKILPLEVAIEVVEGDSAESTPLVLTAVRKMAAAVGTVSSKSDCWTPPGAYAFDVSSPQGRVVARSASLNVVRDPIEGLWIPPTTPILLGPSFSVYVEHRLSSESTVYLTFFVR